MEHGNITVRGTLVQTSNAGIQVGVGTVANRPADAAGLIRYNTDFACFEVNNGSGWSNVGASDVMSVTASSSAGLQGISVTGGANPVVGLSITGLNSGSSVANSTTFLMNDGTNNVKANGAMIATYMDSFFVAQGGDTMTGVLTLAADPVSGLQAATKNYVDNTVAAYRPVGNTVVQETNNVAYIAVKANNQVVAGMYGEAASDQLGFINKNLAWRFLTTSTGNASLYADNGNISYVLTTKDLGQSNPTGLGTANSTGSSNSPARADHVHQFPLATISNTIASANTALTLNDHGRVVVWDFANSSLILPNTFPAGFNCIVCVANATGVPTFTANSGTTIRQADGYTKARKQWSEVSVRVHTNANGAAAVYILSGDMQ